MANRINRAIELLEQGQPIYSTGAGELSYENGRAMAKHMGRLHQPRDGARSPST